MPPDMAETAMRLVWPLLWIFPLALGTLLIARRLGGSLSVLAATIFVASYPVQMQFAAGRIDHHNVQMALTMLMLAGTVNLDRRWGPWLAGVATGLLLAVGLEALVFAAICGAAIALRFVAEPDIGPAARRYAISLALTSLLAFFAQTPPRLWTAGACDMLAVNLLAGLVAAGAGLFLASFVRCPAGTRLSAVLAAGGLALAIYLALDPACLRGPYAAMDARLNSYWLDHVIEVQTLPALVRSNLAMAAALATSPVMALAALAFICREPAIRRDFGWLVVAAVFIAAVLSGAVMVRTLGYAAAFAALVLAGAFARFLPSRASSSFVATACIAFLLSPAVVPMAAALIAMEVSDTQTPAAQRDTCAAKASFAPLSAVPPGLVLADIDLGPHLIAHTRLSALAAPYHRMNEGITTAHEIWAAPVEEAAARLRARGIAYVLLCPARGKLPFEFPGASLRATLEYGEVPAFLEPVPSGEVLRFWRVR
jgi:hypothetical protein